MLRVPTCIESKLTMRDKAYICIQIAHDFHLNVPRFTNVCEYHIGFWGHGSFMINFILFKVGRQIGLEVGHYSGVITMF